MVLLEDIGNYDGVIRTYWCLQLHIGMFEQDSDHNVYSEHISNYNNIYISNHRCIVATYFMNSL